MKNLLTLLTLIIFIYSCTGRRIALSKSVSMATQKRLHKADKKEVSSIMTNRLGKTEGLARSIGSNPDNVYLLDDLVILVKATAIPRDQGILEKQRLARDDSARGLKDFSSKIENIGGRDVYVINQVTEGMKVYRLTTVNRSEDIIVGGFIQYNPGDELKARKALEDIIKGLKFDNE